MRLRQKWLTRKMRIHLHFAKEKAEKPPLYSWNHRLTRVISWLELNRWFHSSGVFGGMNTWNIKHETWNITLWLEILGLERETSFLDEQHVVSPSEIRRSGSREKIRNIIEMTNKEMHFFFHKMTNYFNKKVYLCTMRTMKRMNQWQ